MDCVVAWMVLVGVGLGGCGPSVADGDGDGSGGGSSGVMGSTSDDPAGSSTAPSTCPDFTPDPPGPGVTVTIRNDRDAPIYLVEQYYCDSSYLTVRDPVGEPIRWRTDGWYIPCEELAGPDPVCGGPACITQTVRIDPGGSYADLWTGAVFEDHDIDPDCALTDPNVCGPGCFITRTPQAGTWSVDVEAATALDCGDADCPPCQGDVVDGACILIADTVQLVEPLVVAAGAIRYPDESTALVVFE